MNARDPAGASVETADVVPVRPRSVVHGAVAAAGGIAFLASVAIVVLLEPFAHFVVPSALFVLGCTATVILALDFFWQRVYRRASTGLDFESDDPSWPRTFTKLAGLCVTLGLVAIAYRLLPQYRTGFFGDYWHALTLLAIPWAILAVPYFYFVDRKMAVPRDGYWHMAALVALRFREVDRGIVVQHLLGWAVKAFFLPLMWGFLCDDIRWLFLFGTQDVTNPWKAYDIAYRLIYLADVGIGTLGYITAFRLADTHIRSTEPTLLGWVVALACYDPLWSAVTYRYLSYGTGHSWSSWLAYHPYLAVLWGGGILALSAVYVWATVIFGARFSNLTNRGVITNGPFRFTKHPAYLSKNLSWWMLSVPFLPIDNGWDTIPRCAMLLGVNFIYFMRAKTEEWHMARDPDYVRYALWIEEHGLFRFVRRVPLLAHVGFRRPAPPGIGTPGGTPLRVD
jgi:hypothetical protein